MSFFLKEKSFLKRMLFKRNSDKMEIVHTVDKKAGNYIYENGCSHG
jgi:hypothetical protein